ncbi:MAG: DUF1272 domain-containing protein [Actinomycetota bacterium]|nr:DUF1272 domain-containing protein [Actinomycetota bacterium]
MRAACEGCGATLEEDGLAFICSYECTFCEGCAGARNHLCPATSGSSNPTKRS